MKPSFDKKPVKKVVREVVIKEIPASQMTTVTSVQQTNVIPLEEAVRLRDEAVDIAIKKTMALQQSSAVVAIPVKKESPEEFVGISTKMVNELKGITGIFTALKELSANPLQNMIEQKVGTMAAGVIERSFNVPAPSQNQDFLDRILNSQLGAGLGAGLGQRGPEIIDKLMGTFGKEKVDGWIGGAMGGGRSGQGQTIQTGQRLQGSGNGSDGGQSEADLILKLDSNNPEHITAYAQSQGGIPHDVARKMLMVHQDAFIKQLQDSGSGEDVEKANNIMSRRNNTPNYGSVKEYKHSTVRNVDEDITMFQSPNPYLNTEQQDLNVDKQQLEPEAMIPADLKDKQIISNALAKETNVNNPEILTFDSQPETSYNINLQTDSMSGMNDIDSSGSSGSSNSNNQNNAILSQLVEMITNQNAIVVSLKGSIDSQNETILKLQNDLEEVKNNDIAKTRKKMEKIDEEIFSSVRKTKGVKIGNK